MTAILRLARTQNRRVLLGGLYGNYTISWFGWSQAIDHLRRGRLLTALRQWRQYYRQTSLSRWSAARKLFVEPAAPEALAYWASRRRHGGNGPWSRFSAIRPEFAAATGVVARARQLGHDFLYRALSGSLERIAGLGGIDYLGDWNAAEKSIHGVETRDPTTDVDVVEFCLGIPPEQYLVEDIDRSLVRRAMWGLLPETVLVNRRRGLQAPDWHEKLGARREWLAGEIAAFGQSPLASKAIDLARLERAIRTWPSEGWDKASIRMEYQVALTRALSVARFARWYETANR
jgi:asparagine synthase (glutamine-hydrolysing)